MMLRRLMALVLALGTGTSAMAVVVPLDLTFDPASSSTNKLTMTLYVDAGVDDDSSQKTSSVLSGSNVLLKVDYGFNPTTRAINDVNSIEFTGGQYSLSNVTFNLTFGVWPLEFDENVSMTNVKGTLDTNSPPGDVSYPGGTYADFSMNEHKTRINNGSIAMSGVYDDNINLTSNPINAIFTSGSGRVTTTIQSVSDNWVTYNVLLSIPVNFNEPIDTGSSITARITGSGNFVAQGTFSKALPVAVNDTYGINEDTLMNIPVKGVLNNDTDADSTNLTATKLTNPSHGSLSFNSDGSFTYDPADNWFGTDSFTYRVSDGLYYSNTATVNLNVAPTNDAPNTVADSYACTEDSVLVVDAAGVLANDTDIENNPLSAFKLTNPAHGSVSLSRDGSFIYAPQANYFGADSFTYHANDGIDDSAETVVNLLITGVNDAPVAMADSYETPMDTPLVVTDSALALLANDIDVDGDALEIYCYHPTSTGEIYLINPSIGSFAFVPRAGFVGDTWFWYRVVDPSGLRSEYAIARIKVTAPGESQVLPVPEPGVLALLAGALVGLALRRRSR